VNEPAWDRPGKGYGDSVFIFKAIAEKKPDFMLWIGDNTYTREGDWNTKGGFLHRYTHTRSLPEMKALLASSHHYATWDDHEYGPNDSDRSFWNKKIASETFETFWPMPNKPMGDGPVCQTFGWGDCQFFMLDDRWFRAPNADKDSTKSYLGEAQINWLMDALTFSKANFKIIACGGQVINDAAVYENYAAYPVERRRLLDRITRAGISGVLFLSGDRHHAELSRLERQGTYPLYDLTTSPLTAGIHNPGKEANTLRVEGTLFNGHNFARIQVNGEAKKRVLKMNLFDNRGNLVWEKELKAEELK
jgi:alkaline phosphatase D